MIIGSCYALGVLALLGAVMAVWLRSFVACTLSLLITLFSVSLLLDLLGSEPLGTLLLWLIGGGNLLLLLHTSLIVSPPQTDVLKSRISLTSLLKAALVIYGFLTLAMAIKIPDQITELSFKTPLQSFSDLFQEQFGFLFFVTLASSLFIFIGTLLFLRRREIQLSDGDPRIA